MAGALLEEVASSRGRRGLEQKVTIHSGLFYWWPVWLVGFLMALWTALDDSHMVLVPAGSTIQNTKVKVPDDRTVDAPLLHVARSKVPGLLFVATLGVVVACSSGWMHGLRAHVFVAVVASLAFVLTWLGGWPALYDWARYLDVRINLGGYLVLATVFFLLWAWFFFFVDRQTYVVFTAGEVRVYDSVLDEGRVYDTAGATVQVEERDWFRWLVGGGAGDLIVHFGDTPRSLELPNVLRVRKRLEEIEELLRTRESASRSPVHDDSGWSRMARGRSL